MRGRADVHRLDEDLYQSLVFFGFPASALVAGSSGVPGSVSRAVQSGSTFLHSLIKLSNKINSKLQNSSGGEVDLHLAVLKPMFNLLSNLALSAECRGVIWKVSEWGEHRSHMSHAFKQCFFFFVSWRRHEGPAFISETKKKHHPAIAKRKRCAFSNELSLILLHPQCFLTQLQILVSES